MKDLIFYAKERVSVQCCLFEDPNPGCHLMKKSLILSAYKMQYSFITRNFYYLLSYDLVVIWFVYTIASTYLMLFRYTLGKMIIQLQIVSLRRKLQFFPPFYLHLYTYHLIGSTDKYFFKLQSTGHQYVAPAPLHCNKRALVSI